jgi:Bifunctional DNA primase/polymerase, N-terminal
MCTNVRVTTPSGLFTFRPTAADAQRRRARGPMTGTRIFAEWASLYRERGYWSRPIALGSKACKLSNWQRPDDKIRDDELASWIARCGDHGIGLLMGSPFPDGTTLGALDIDHDDYTRLGRALLRDPPCGRIGKKGAVFFVRVRGRLSNPEFRVQGDEAKRYGKVAECLFVKKLCVIPPTIHPETGRPYEWIAKPLHEVDFEELPIVEMSHD